MALDYKRLSEQIIKNVGGADNIIEFSYCMTRLRLKLKDTAQASDAIIESFPDVKGVVKQAGQYQIVLGHDVNNLIPVFEEILKNPKKNKGASKKFKKEGLLTRIVAFVSACVLPLIPIMLGSAVLKLILIVLETVFLVSNTDPTFIFFWSISDAIFYFMPIFLAFCMAKHTGGSVALYCLIGAVLCYPNVAALFIQPTGEFLGAPCVFIFGVIPVICSSYSNSFIPIFLMSPVMKWAEKIAERVSWEPGRLFLKPLIFLVICAPIALIVLGPLCTLVGTYLAWGIELLSAYVPWLTMGILAALMPFIVMTGMHYALLPLGFETLTSIGFDSIIMAPLLCANLAQAAAALAVALKTKDSKLRSLGIVSSIPAFFAGVTEPAFFGVNLRFIKPLACAMAGAGIGGLFCGFMGIQATAIAEFPSLLTLTSFSSSTGDPTLGIIMALIAGTIVVIITFASTYICYQDGSKESIEIATKFDTIDEVAESKKDKNDPILVPSPISGVSKPLSECKDKVFANGSMGKGVMIVPSYGRVYAPSNATITMLPSSKHAIGLTTQKGVEIMIHIGMDTVKLKGKGFRAYCEEGQKVKRGDLLLDFNIDEIKAEGYSINTPVIISNTDNYADVVVKLGLIDAGEKLMDVLLVKDETATTKVQEESIKAPVSGQVMPLNQCPDELFASGKMGHGFIIEP